MINHLISLKQYLILFSLTLFCNLSEASTWCNNRVIKIMPIGDSITQGGRKPSEYSYRLPLSKILKQAHYKVDFIGSQGALDDENFKWPSDFDNNHEGYYGETTWSVRNTFIKNSKPLPAPDIALIQIGTNDLGKWNMFAAVFLPLKDIISKLRQKNPKVIILLSELNHNWTSSKYIRLHLKLLALFDNSSESRIILVPHYKNWDNKIDTFDSLHPNPTGQLKMAKVWFKYIKKACEAK